MTEHEMDNYTTENVEGYTTQNYGGGYPQPVGETATGDVQEPNVSDDDRPVAADMVDSKLVPLVQVIKTPLIGVGFFVFLILVLACFVATVFFPSPYVDSETNSYICNGTTTVFNTTDCSGADLITQSRMSIIVGHLSLLNQEFSLDGQFENIGGVTQGGVLSMNVDINGFDDGDETQHVLYERYNIDVEFDCDSDEQYCNKFNFFVYTVPSYDNYNITFTLVKNTFMKETLGNMRAFVKVVNSKYSFASTFWRFAFITLSCIFTAFFILCSRKYPMDSWPFENKCNFYLLLAIILMDNPLHAFKYVIGVTGFKYTEICFTSFSCVFLMLYVLVIFEALRMVCVPIISM